jgi:UDP-N-acetyl-D-mannosaminuronate dehydrogenase
MFEQTLQEMTAIVIIENEMYQTLTASNVGVSPEVVFCGSRRYTFEEANRAIAAIDQSLRGCSKCYYKRIRATRMQFVYAFGPEMIDFAGEPPAGRAA